MPTALDRFLHYVTFDTQSNPDSESCPSTMGQRVFAEYLVGELNAIGLEDVRLDANGYVTATLPATAACAVPVIGFIAHLDTSPDFSGHDVRPLIREGSVCTDGSTLLGADDKAGIAAIVTAVDTLRHRTDVPHGKVRIAFTPDEEIGRGADRFDVTAFGCDFAYTVDGGALGELEYENFNAAAARVSVRGVDIHPGEAKGRMRNASLLAAEFIALLPADERPETTQGYEGFYHLTGMTGTVGEASLSLLLRDFSAEGLERKKAFLRKLIDELNQRYPDAFTLSIKDQYRNMAEILRLHPDLIELAAEAMRQVGVTPLVRPIRGGTDGARLSFMGLPCPNLFTGGHNFHGPQEVLSIAALEKSVETVIRIITLNAHRQ
ncbi:MAG: peptidase T [Tannerellaceae bacterium]|jgi:tripeptide aminopeptidase|nr:peptidase T [Tannerellaceae bacterium]